MSGGNLTENINRKGNQMTTSVILSCYNGSKYIIEQLESLRRQTRTPDEVIIADDCSSDETVRKIREYTDRYKLDKWKIYVNKHNKGWRCNFIHSFALASSDIIFPCDQDDIWNPEKIEMMASVMEKHPEIGVLVSNFKVLNYVPETKIPGVYAMKYDNSLEKIEFTSRFMNIRRPGCVYGFKSEFMGLIKQIWTENQSHDALLWRLGMITDSLYLYCFESIKWRRFEGCATFNTLDNWEERKKEYAGWIEQCTFFEKWLSKRDIEGKAYKIKTVRKCRKAAELIFRIKEKNRIQDYMMLTLYGNLFANPKSVYKEIYQLLRHK